MPLLTVSDIEAQVETDAGSVALQTILDSEEAEIIRRYGPHNSATEELPGFKRRLILSQRAQAVTTVTEDGTELTSDDYALRSGLMLERSGRDWGRWVTVTYEPLDQIHQRRHVLIQLCKLSLAYSGYESQQGLEVGERSLDYQQERERLLSSLASREGLFA